MRFHPTPALLFTLGLVLYTASLAVPLPETIHDPAWVDRRIEKWQPTAREKRWESIGWAKNLREAERLGKAHNRPVFLFTHDGRLNVGRC
jgi:hypothetical protein